MSVKVVATLPRSWARPGTVLEVAVAAGGVTDGPVAVHIELLDVDEVVATAQGSVVAAGGVAAASLPLLLPLERRRGYGLVATVRDSSGRTGRGRTLVEALDGWWEAPRHIAWTAFEPGTDPDRLVQGARAWHATVAQAYDWMYRHYRYSAPTEPFTDALGRLVSHDVVRSLVRAGSASGIATLAYGSVYGAEPEYVDAHPDERVFDADGSPISLGGAFFINDLRPGPWRRRLLDEYEHACRRFGFDGIHMDTYGPPHEAFGADGAPIRFDLLYPGLIEEASARVAATGRDRRVLFNCVEGFPLDAVARTATAAHYLELWPPDDRYADIVRWIARAREAAPEKAVVIAAYVPALRDAGQDVAARASALETAILLTTVVHAAGAFHHVLAEDDRVLVEGYYPAAVRLRPAESAALRAAWRFGARYVHLLSDPSSRTVSTDGIELRDSDGDLIPVRATPEAGTVWLRSTETPSGPVLSLVDLRAQHDDSWLAPRQPAAQASGWVLHWGSTSAHGGLAMSPWARAGDPTRLAASTGGVQLPAFRRWLLVLGNRPTDGDAGP